MKLSKTLLVGVVLAAVMLSGCDKEIHSEQREYEVVGVKPPKHMRVDLRDVKTGELFKDVSVSKRCSGWETLKIGTHFWLIERTYQGESFKYHRVYENGEIGHTVC